MTPAPSVVRARVSHRRTRPFTYAFEHRTTMWLVDVAQAESAFPRWLRAFASIRPEDHFATNDTRPLAQKVRDYLDAHDLPWTASRVLVLANARSLGYVFDPLSTYFCFDADGRLEGVLAEVHNTYGERHCYPLDVAGARTATVDKEFYVFTAAVHGDFEPATRRRVVGAVLRDPVPSQRVSALIRWHGVRLWLRRLPVIPRRPHPATKGM